MSRWMTPGSCTLSSSLASIGTGRLRGIGLFVAGMLAGLAVVAHAEIVQGTPPRVPAPVDLAHPSALSGTGTGADIRDAVAAGGVLAEIVLPRPGRVEAVPPATGATAPQPGLEDAVQETPRSNIVWPSTAEARGAAEDDGQGAMIAVFPGNVDASLPADGAAEIVGVPDGPPLQRALAAYGSGADPRSYSEAARWFKVAADAGDRRGAMAYAYLQGLGLGVRRDPAAARRSLRQLSAAGVVRADYLISLLLAAERRPGGERQQAELRERAARAGDAVAQNAMGVHYQVQGDRTTAQMWYQRAADNGSAAAGINLASLARGDEARRQVGAGVEAAADGDGEALFALARRYHRGEGVAVDYGKALQLYRSAAANGSKPAQQMLGLIQSRMLAGGVIDPVWMHQLASTAVGAAGGNLVSRSTSIAQPQLDDPLAGLADLGP
ncbi:MAG TPA: tetratricopeptide repeat protein [Lysobacter sp.]|nr:tetratricopeptide repeat protein [Lysobacter sp.]